MEYCFSSEWRVLAGSKKKRLCTPRGRMLIDSLVRRLGPLSDVPIIHAITNDEVVARPDFIDQACAVMRVLGNRGALHLRANRITGARFQQLAEGLAAAQGLTGGWLVVNDRIDVALLARARG